MSDTEDKLNYKHVLELKDDETAVARGDRAVDTPDRRDGRIYVYDEQLRLAVEVALVTGRPLLLLGEPGSGKSSFAAYVARNWNARYYEHVVTARTEANDILWSYDAVRRLGDAQVRKGNDPPLNDYDYVEPGALWWGLNRVSALRRGAPDEAETPETPQEPFADINENRSQERSVVLLDEIDKADPDMPNALLVPLGSLQFRVSETRTHVRPPDTDGNSGTGKNMTRMLVVITTNEERELPQAFLRRCVVHVLEYPDEKKHAKAFDDKLVEIAARHYPRWGCKFTKAESRRCKQVAGKIRELRQQAPRLSIRRPGTAEYLDAVRACRSLHIGVNSDAWKEVERVVLCKRQELESPT